MASIRILKKSVNQTLSIFIDDCYDKRAEIGSSSLQETEALVDKAIVLFDELILMINSPNTSDSKSAHYKQVEDRLEQGVTDLYKELGAVK